jgi:hypothetical protein
MCPEVPSATAGKDAVNTLMKSKKVTKNANNRRQSSSAFIMASTEQAAAHSGQAAPP